MVWTPKAKVVFVGCSDSFSDGFAIVKLKVDFEELSSLVCSEFPKENTVWHFGSSLSAFFPNTREVDVTGSCCFSSVLPKTNNEADGRGEGSMLPKVNPPLVAGISSFFASDVLHMKGSTETLLVSMVPKLKLLLFSEVTKVLVAAGVGLIRPVPKLKPVDEELGSSSFFSCCARLDTPNWNEAKEVGLLKPEESPNLKLLSFLLSFLTSSGLESDESPNLKFPVDLENLKPSLIGFKDPESDDTPILKPPWSPNLKFSVLIKVWEGPEEDDEIPNLKDGAAGSEVEEDVPKPSKIQKTPQRHWINAIL